MTEPPHLQWEVLGSPGGGLEYLPLVLPLLLYSFSLVSVSY